MTDTSSPPSAAAPASAAREVRVAATLAQLRAGVRQRQGELASLGERAEGRRLALAELKRREFLEEPLIHSPRRLLGPLLVFARKVVFHLFLKGSLRPIVQQQNAYNQAVSGLLQDLVAAQEAQQRQLERLAARLDALDRRRGGRRRRGRSGAVSRLAGKRIVVCATQVPFARGGAEILVDSLAEELRHRQAEVDVVRLPFAWGQRLDILKSALAWRLVDLSATVGERVDLVIATRFPSYVVRHPNKVVWLVHQHRQVYELLGTPYSDFNADDARDRKVIEMIRTLDRRVLAEARGLFAIADNAGGRLERYNGLTATTLYPPPQLGDAYRRERYGDFILGVGRLDPLKRFDLLVRALARSRGGWRAVVAGSGPQAEELAELARREGVAERLELRGFVADEELLELYASCRGVFYAPFDEDYGYVTVEAMKASKAVVTCDDSGAVLELVRDGVNGLVCAPQPRPLAGALDRLAADGELARRLGEAGRESVAAIGWDQVIDALTATL